MSEQSNSTPSFPPSEQSIADRAVKLNAEMEELRLKLEQLTRDSQELLAEIGHRQEIGAENSSIDN